MFPTTEAPCNPPEGCCLKRLPVTKGTPPRCTAACSQQPSLLQGPVQKIRNLGRDHHEKPQPPLWTGEPPLRLTHTRDRPMTTEPYTVANWCSASTNAPLLELPDQPA